MLLIPRKLFRMFIKKKWYGRDGFLFINSSLNLFSLAERDIMRKCSKFGIRQNSHFSSMLLVPALSLSILRIRSFRFGRLWTHEIRTYSYFLSIWVAIYIGNWLKVFDILNVFLSLSSLCFYKLSIF